MQSPGGVWLPPGHELREKQDNVLDSLSRSVAAAVQPAPQGGSPVTPYLIWIAQIADDFPSWGANTKARDAALRTFFPTESFMFSALSTVVARNAALGWKITGDEATVDASVRMLNNANYGGGWEQLISQVSIDLYSQDTGAFIEFIRTADSPEAPVVMVNHLDAGRCFPTGDPEFPVTYQDVQGRFHRMPWYTVVQLLEIPAGLTPAPNGQFYRLQYCAISRALRAAQIIRDVTTYKSEKVGGRFQRAIHLISGVAESEVTDALTRQSVLADSSGQTRYIQPAIVGGIDPNAAIGHTQIDLASLPEGWSEEDMIKNYILALSMAFLTDYQEFAPLPGGGLGTSNQSDVLNQKSRGKGSGLFQKMIARVLNLHGALPANVLFEWDEPDVEADKLLAEAKKTRAEQRKLRIDSGELDPLAARQEALADGDITQEIFDELNKREEDEEREAIEQDRLRMEQLSAMDDQGSLEGEDNGREGGANAREGEDGAFGERAAGAVALGNLMSGRLHRAYSTAADDAHSLGYFDDTEQRKKVGAAIGPALARFEEEMRELGVWDIPIGSDDADRIVDASVGRGEREVDPERLEYEAESAAVIERALESGLRVARRRLRAETAEDNT